MNETTATKKPPTGPQVGVGATASLISRVWPANSRFVILILAWLPVGKYPWVGVGGVGVAHTHGQATCNFKFLNVVEGAGNTFYDIGDGTSNTTDMFTDGLPHKGTCNDNNYKPILLNPATGRQFIESKDLIGDTSGFIQDDYGAHSIDNLNTEEIVYSIHIYYPPYAHAWAFHQNHDTQHQSGCEGREGAPQEGYRNCVTPFSGECGTTSMKLWLEIAANATRDGIKEKLDGEHVDLVTEDDTLENEKITTVAPA